MAVEELPNHYEELPALVFDKEDKEDKKLPEGDLLITYTQGEPLVMVYKLETKNPLINWSTSQTLMFFSEPQLLSQSLVHEVETNEVKTFEDLAPKEYHKWGMVKDIICERASVDAPSGKLPFYFFWYFLCLLMTFWLFSAISSLLKLITKDTLYMCMLFGLLSPHINLLMQTSRCFQCAHSFVCDEWGW